MIPENRKNSLIREPSVTGLARTESMFHSKWMIIKEEEKGMAEETEELITMFKKSKKSKAPTLSDKVSSANIKDWKEQKLLPAAFYENYKMIFQDKSKIGFTYGSLEKVPELIPPNFIYYEEGDPEYLHLSEMQKKRIDDYGAALQEYYLKHGLTSEEAALRKEAEGPNKMPEVKKTPEIIKFLREITNLFSNLLWIAAVLCFIGYGLDPGDKSNLYLAIVIILIILVTGTFSWYQNRKSEKILETFRSFGISQVSVIRDGNEKKISGVDLVRGDVVRVGLGEKIPADIRIFESHDLQVDNSPLTGESIPVKISFSCGEKGRESPLEATNLVFFSTLCKNGSGIGIVIQTGINTFMGRIADLAYSAAPTETTLQKEVTIFIKLIAKLAISFGIVFFILGFIIKYPIITNFIFAIGIVVANVPEGLLTVVTISLSITAQKMLARNVMVKNLQSVETLGSITVICSDKTGTLTQNKMSVVHLWYDLELKKIKPDQDDIYVDGQLVPMSICNPEKDLSFPFFQFASTCGSKGKFLKETPEDYLPVIQGRNRFLDKHPRATYEEIQAEISRLKKEFQHQYSVEYESNIEDRITDTDASETGILKFFEKIENVENVRSKYPIHVDPYSKKAVIIPFNSTLKFTSFLRRVPDENNPGRYQFWLAIKGAPERIIDRCNRFLLQGQEHLIDYQFKADFANANKCFALKGERVIGVAFTKLDPNIYTEDFKFYNHPQEELNPDFKFEVPEPNYPLTNLCFVGLIALEDPPRNGVKQAIATCNRAGIKVIMVTGDQPLTAASIAYQIGIIKDLDDIPEIIKEREKLSTLEEAEKKSNTIIITGDRLYKYMKEDEALSEENPRKGAFLREWLMKRDVVFARTSPEQKLIIVDGCQKLSHVVAVTGDGVNDSPAIKKADIGIAMGKVGTDVAKDAADILLLDDNFANIVRGIKQGRIIFDTLKKIIGYNLTSNISELVPFLGFVIFQFPLPFTIIMVLLIDVLTDVYPDISLAYEPGEKNIMFRQPRNARTDRLCTRKLIIFSYLMMGIIETAGAFLMYFAAFHSYGFPPSFLFYIVQKQGIVPNRRDVFNPYDEQFNGNSNAFIASYADLLGIFGQSRTIFVESQNRVMDFVTEGDTWIDYRLFRYEAPLLEYSRCDLNSVGYSDDGPVCYHIVEATRHAQSAYLLGVILMQIANGNVFKTISASLLRHPYINWPLNSAYFVEIIIICALLYIPGLNVGLQLRPLRIEHWVPCLGMWIVYILYSEIHKFLMRNVKHPDGSPGFFYEYFYY